DVGGGNSRGEKFPRRKRKLIALLGLALTERAAAIHFGAAAPGAAELAVGENRDTALAPRRGEVVGGNKGVRGGHDEGGFGQRQCDELVGASVREWLAPQLWAVAPALHRLEQDPRRPPCWHRAGNCAVRSDYSRPAWFSRPWQPPLLPRGA